MPRGPLAGPPPPHSYYETPNFRVTCTFAAKDGLSPASHVVTLSQRKGYLPHDF